MKRTVRSLALLLACAAGLASGCGEQTTTTAAPEEPVVTADTPFVVRLNAESQIFIHDRWVDLYTEQGTFRNYLRKQADRYRQACADEGVALIQQRQPSSLSPLKEYLPTEVIIEALPGTKAGSISHVQRAAHEHGFMKFRVQVVETNPDATGQGQ